MYEYKVIKTTFLAGRPTAVVTTDTMRLNNELVMADNVKQAVLDAGIEFALIGETRWYVTSDHSFPFIEPREDGYKYDYQAWQFVAESLMGSDHGAVYEDLVADANTAINRSGDGEFTSHDGIKFQVVAGWQKYDI